MNILVVHWVLLMMNLMLATRPNPVQATTRMKNEHIHRKMMIARREKTPKSLPVNQRKMEKLKVRRTARKLFPLKARAQKTHVMIRRPKTRRRSPRMSGRADRKSPTTVRIVLTQRTRMPRVKSPDNLEMTNPRTKLTRIKTRRRVKRPRM